MKCHVCNTEAKITYNIGEIILGYKAPYLCAKCYISWYDFLRLHIKELHKEKGDNWTKKWLSLLKEWKEKYRAKINEKVVFT